MGNNPVSKKVTEYPKGIYLGIYLFT